MDVGLDIYKVAFVIWGTWLKKTKNRTMFFPLSASEKPDKQGTERLFKIYVMT